MTERRVGVALLCADPDLGLQLPREALDEARRLVVAPRDDIESGPWHPPSREDYGDGAFALLILSGLITRDTILAGRSASHLLGPGDIIEPWSGSDRMLPSATRWTVGEPASVAVLDKRFALAARRWPELSVSLTQRLAAQAERATVHAALGQLPRVELRILGLLWHMAERWGRVTAEGVLVPLRLTHENIGQLVGAQRPTVTLALRTLTTSGAVARRPHGGWLLAPGSERQFATPGELLSPSSPGARAARMVS